MMTQYWQIRSSVAVNLAVVAISLLLLISCNSRPMVPEAMESPAGPGSHLPRLVTDGTGKLFMSWVEPDSANAEVSVLKYAALEGDTWSTPEKIVQGDSWFVNWADFPVITAVSGRPKAAHWLQKVPGSTYSYHIKVVVAQNDGSWSEPFSPHLDNTATEHGFVSMIPWQNGSTLAVWLDGRQTENRAEAEYFNMEKAMTLRSAVITGDGFIRESKLIDDTVCDCCQTALIPTPDGALAAYRNRTGEEVRDIYVTRYTNGAWSEPVPIHDDGWKIGACPVNGPALAIHDSTVVVAWYTGADSRRSVKAAVSRDAGASFSNPVKIDGGNPLGRVDAQIAKDGTVFVSWMEKGSDNSEWAELRVQALAPDGRKLASQTITTMDASRSSGFPQMELQNDRLVFAWTQTGEAPEIKMASLSTPLSE